MREEDFLQVFSVGLFLAVLGTLTYSVSQDWNPVDALYFSVSTLTTTSVSDPDLVVDDGWLKIFTILYQLIGIGILVEILRRLGLSFVEVRRQEQQRDPRSAPEHP
ncbi:MAG TPA: potassium channel family protein [Thermoleophilaceae bacterium]|nr:potassium channel family protein [Thermoleophilaceae bacterium]